MKAYLGEFMKQSDYIEPGEEGKVDNIQIMGKNINKKQPGP